uniref:Uncharacterized protein n=1 Tax=Oryza meridionalis TaxID=40149 RepID=A0A0E0CIF5_9ORYZ
MEQLGGGFGWRQRLRRRSLLLTTLDEAIAIRHHRRLGNGLAHGDEGGHGAGPWWRIAAERTAVSAEQDSEPALCPSTTASTPNICDFGNSTPKAGKRLAGRAARRPAGSAARRGRQPQAPVATGFVVARSLIRRLEGSGG